MARILLIAATTGYQTRSLAAAARRRGVEVTLATDRCHAIDNPWNDKAIPIRFDDPAHSVEELSRICRTAPIDGIVAAGDRPTSIASMLAARLALPWHPPEATAACRDKNRTRELFRQAGLPAVAHTRVPLESNVFELAAAARFPCVLKPLGLSGSRGVIRADNVTEFAAAFERIRRLLERPEILQRGEETDRAIQIEDYIPGREFALEGLMSRGALLCLAIFDKPDPLEGPFFEETIYVTPSREPADLQRAMIETTSRAVRALGLWHGPIHAEMRIGDTGIYMLEIAARPIGGLCARTLQFRTESAPDPVSLEELIVLHAVGRMPANLAPASSSSGVMMIPIPREGVFQAVEGTEKALAHEGIESVIVTAKEGERLVPLPEGAGYPGFIFATGRDPAFVENALRRAHAELRFNLSGVLPVVP